MKISKKQIMQLILVAQRVANTAEYSYFTEEYKKTINLFIVEITDQQSDELKEVE